MKKTTSKAELRALMKKTSAARRCSSDGAGSGNYSSSRQSLTYGSRSASAATHVAPAAPAAPARNMPQRAPAPGPPVASTGLVAEYGSSDSDTELIGSDSHGGTAPVPAQRAAAAAAANQDRQDRCGAAEAAGAHKTAGGSACDAHAEHDSDAVSAADVARKGQENGRRAPTGTAQLDSEAEWAAFQQFAATIEEPKPSIASTGTHDASHGAGAAAAPAMTRGDAESEAVADIYPQTEHVDADAVAKAEAEAEAEAQQRGEMEQMMYVNRFQRLLQRKAAIDSRRRASAAAGACTSRECARSDARPAEEVHEIHKHDIADKGADVEEQDGQPATPALAVAAALESMRERQRRRQRQMQERVQQFAAPARKARSSSGDNDTWRAKLL